MMTVIKTAEWAMYGVGALGIGAALFGIYSVCLAFARGQDHLLQQKREEFLARKSRLRNT